MTPSAVTETQNWPEAAIAIAGMVLVGSVIVIVVWQTMATWRTRNSESRETDYRELAEDCADAQRRTAAALEQLLRELRRSPEDA